MPLSRRTFIQALSLLLCLPTLEGTAATPLALHVGERPAPAHIRRIISAGAPADMLLLAAAPEKLLGFSSFDFSQFPDAPSRRTSPDFPDWGDLPDTPARYRWRRCSRLNPIWWWTAAM